MNFPNSLCFSPTLYKTYISVCSSLWHHHYIMKSVTILDNTVFVANICSTDRSSRDFANMSEIYVQLKQFAVRDFLFAGGEKPTCIHGHLLTKFFSENATQLLQT